MIQARPARAEGAQMAAPPLPGFLSAIAPVLNHYGYLAVGGLVLLEDFGVPAPGETVLIAASVYAGAGRLNIVVVGLVAMLAAIAGDNIGYAIGHFGGHALALRFGKFILLTPERLEKAERFFNRHGGKIVTVARFIEGLRQANGIIAGIAEMPWRRFLAYNALGAALWVGLWTSLGYLAGNNLIAIYQTISRYSLYALTALALVAAALVARAVIKRRRRASRRGGTAEPQPAREPGGNTAEPQPAREPGGNTADPQPAREPGGNTADPQPAREPGGNTIRS
jgi:membrane protein DedA with SNARE-associated domain